MKKAVRKIAGFASLLLFFPSLVFAGSIAESELDQLFLGMKRNEIITLLGQPDSSRFEGANAQDKPVEKLQYGILKRLKEPDATGRLEVTYPCSLTLVDGVLSRVDRER